MHAFVDHHHDVQIMSKSCSGMTMETMAASNNAYINIV
jgi:hypothetical protein